MRLSLALLLIFLLGSIAPSLAQSPDDQYLQIYTLIQEGNGLVDQNLSSQALAKYTEARTALQRFQNGYPEWNPEVVKFRLDFLGARISELSAKTQAAQPTTTTPASGPGGARPGLVEKPEPNPLEGQVKSLQEQLAAAQSDKALLEAKLKEALSAQPAAIDPRELQKAEDRIRNLQKENELLTTTLANERTALRPANDADKKLQRSLDETRQQLASEKEIVARLTRDNEALLAQAKSKVSDTRLTSEIKKQDELIRQLEKERNDYRKKLETATKESGSKKNKQTPGDVASLEKELTAARARLSALEAQRVPFSTEELALLRKPETKLVTSTPGTAKPAENTVTAPQPAKTAELSPQATALIAEARKHFAARELDQAEQKYSEAVRLTENNPQALGDLATIQMERNRLDDAEKTIQEALKVAPDNAYCLSVQGQIRSHQGRLDEAVEALSRAASLDGQSPEIQNWLGVALAQKGLRAPAESALRKAIQLRPGYAQAHNNLAVIYAGQKPPLTELARWHYQKALAGGLSRNPDLEKMLQTASVK